MANVEGKAYALNVVTPLVPWKAFFLRIFFRIILLAMGFVTWVGGPSRLGILGKIQLLAVQVKLKQLSFIYFARWVVIGRRSFPRLDPRQPEETLKYDYMIFCSNFTGTWDAYIDAFSEVIPTGIDGIWGWTVNYDRTRPVTRFKRHIAANQADTDYYYSAYPGASTTDVRQAIDLDAKLKIFADRALVMPADQFDATYSKFLVDIQGDLATTGHDASPKFESAGGPGDVKATATAGATALGSNGA